MKADHTTNVHFPGSLPRAGREESKSCDKAEESRRIALDEAEKITQCRGVVAQETTH